MKIVYSNFVTSVADGQNVLHDGKPQIAFVGRSNVGKSSLLNALAGNKKLARTSSTPGRTRMVNYFLINGSVYFVDLPGYGYAKAAKTLVESWQSLIEPYLVDNRDLKLTCLLMDIRRVPNADDRQMIMFLNYYRIPYIIIATKCDKLSKSAIKPACRKLAHAIGVGDENV